jgi:hypothetical protein
MDIVFGPDGNFDEVYLYEELMEADLHAIVRQTNHPHFLFAADPSDRTHPFFAITLRSAPANRSRTRTSSPSSTKRSAV